MFRREWVVLAMAVIALASLINNEHRILYLVQSLLTALLVFTVLDKSRFSSFLFFISTFFVLGNWLKLSVHTIFGHDYIEPTGAFWGSSDEWVRYYTFSIIITATLVLAKVVRDLFRSTIRLPSAPKISKRQSKLIFYVSAIAVFSIYVLNGIFGFYRIGVERNLYLPFGLDAPASFLVFLGAPMLIAVLATNHAAKVGRVTSTNLLVVAATTVFASVTMYSRATAAIVLIPIVMGLSNTARALTGRGQALKPLITVALALLVSVALVSIVRIFAYDNSGALDAKTIQYYLKESSSLFIDRWVGVESMMTAVSRSQSPSLFWELLKEDPAVGVRGLYQSLSGSSYAHMADKTFLSLPGAFGLLAFSGSPVIVIAGVLTICWIGCVFEGRVRAAFPAYPALGYVVSARIAYQASQMGFPLLAVPYLVQIVFFLFALKLYAPGVRRP